MAGFNFSVRNGKRWSPRAIATLVSLAFFLYRSSQPPVSLYKVKKSGNRGRFSSNSRSCRSSCPEYSHAFVSVSHYVFPCVTRYLCVTPVSYTCAACAAFLLSRRGLFVSFRDCSPERVRVISIARLWTLPPLHLQPIDVIVSDDPCVEILS